MRPARVEAARLVVGAAVADVEGALVRREGQAVGLVEARRRRPTGGRSAGRSGRRSRHAAAPAGSPAGGRSSGSVNQIVPSRVTTTSLGELSGSPASASTTVSALAGRAIDGADPGRLAERALLADEQPAVGRERHPVRGVRMLAHGGDADRLEPVELEATDRAGSLARRRGEVQRPRRTYTGPSWASTSATLTRPGSPPTTASKPRSYDTNARVSSIVVTARSSRPRRRP